MIATLEKSLNRMAAKDTPRDPQKKKLPHGPSDIQRIEDRVHQILRKLQDLRSSLQNGPLHETELMSGTLMMHLGEALTAATKLYNDHERQLTEYSVKSVRDRVINERPNQNRKR